MEPRPNQLMLQTTVPRLVSRLMGLAILALALAAAQPNASAQANPNPPTKLTYQGFLTDQNGIPLGNTAPVNKTVVFRIFDALTGGNRLWSSQQTVTIDKGHFSVLLGEGSAYAAETFNPDLTGLFTGNTASDRFLEITVDSTTIAPRQQFLPSPYSVLARRAMELAGGSAISGTLRVSGTLTADGILTASAATVAGTVSAATVITGSLSASGTVAGNAISATNGVSAASVTATGTITAATFVGNGTIPIGGIIMWNGLVTAVPSGWALCDGANGTPDLRSRFVVGASGSANPSGLTRYDKGNTGGSEKHTLTEAEMPRHRHNFQDIYYSENAGRNEGWMGSGDTDQDNRPHYTANATDYTGGGEAHENRPPYYALAFIMRTQ